MNTETIAWTQYTDDRCPRCHHWVESPDPHRWGIERLCFLCGVSITNDQIDAVPAFGVGVIRIVGVRKVQSLQTPKDLRMWIRSMEELAAVQLGGYSAVASAYYTSQDYEGVWRRCYLKGEPDPDDPLSSDEYRREWKQERDAQARRHVALIFDHLQARRSGHLQSIPVP